MSLDIQNTKIDLIQWLTTIDNAEILKKIKSIKEIEIKAEWSALSENERKSIEEGIEDVKAGNTILYADFKKLYERNF